jgi:hypothetical protein
VSERRAATLTAQGGTTCDIGQALFVTPKTVEVHLSNVYRKQRLRLRRRKPHDDGGRGGGQDRQRLRCAALPGPTLERARHARIAGIRAPSGQLR